MGSIFFLIFLVMMFKGKGRDALASDIFKLVFGLCFLGAATSLFFTPFGFVGGVILAAWLINKYGKKNKKSKKDSWWQDQSYDRQDTVYQEYREQAKKSTRSSILPAAAKKRRKIVETFNEKYELYLTSEQIKGIVEASYFSEIWKKEIEAMTQKYETLSQWYQSYTKWLRVYLRVFHVQEVTSDIRQQESICFYAFEEVFLYADSLSDMPLSEKIRAVNEKFYASFDDVSFMIAYRFLESKGKKHDLGRSGIIREDADIDELLHKYDSQRAAQ